MSEGESTYTMKTEIEQALREMPPQHCCEVMDSGEVPPPPPELQVRMDKSAGVEIEDCAR